MTIKCQRLVRWFATVVILCSVCVAKSFAAPVDDLKSSFLNPPDDARIMMRWWWFGPAVTKPELEREMRLMKEGGIGGFEVQPVYPLVLDDESKGIKTLPFLSDPFLDTLRFTSDKARELGLRFDLTLGSGWPFGGPTVSIDHAAGRLRYEHVKVDVNSHFVKVPAIGPGEKLLAVFLARVEGSSIAPDSVRELTSSKDGIVNLTELPTGAQQEVMFFISSRTGMQVKRPAVGGEGFVLDHMNRAATDGYLKTVGDRLLGALGPNRPYAIFCDSLEVYNSDWSADFLEEFQKRRGYDLKPHLPALVNDMGRQTQALRRDWGVTLTELLNERFLAPVQEWSKRNHTLFRIQNYGVPAAAISGNQYADIPEGEGAQWKVVRAARWASSASHLYGRPIASSETWTWLHSPAFRATPLDMKAEADIHFLQGINQLIGHGWPYTAPGIEYPGWRFYAAAVLNDKNPWWIVMPDIAKYLQRVSFMMRQGQPANDVAVYLPNGDALAHMNPGNPHLIELLRDRVGADLLPAILESGYNLDFFDDESFKQVGRVDNGSLVLGKNKYKVVILPAVETIPGDTYLRLAEFARNGGVLIATRRTPSEQPGFLAKQSDHEKILELSRTLFGGSGNTAHLVTDEKNQLGGTLNRLLTPDVALSPQAPQVGFIHRRTADADIYFVANTSNTAQHLKATFRIPDKAPEWWNPMDGTIKQAAVEQQTVAGTVVSLDLEPYGSRVLVFSGQAKLKMSDGAKTPVMGTLPGFDWNSGWQFRAGATGVSRPLEKLSSWTEDEETRYFSGVVIYEKTFTISDRLLQEVRSGSQLRLELGEGQALTPENLRNGMQAWLEPPVREAAVVYINGQRVGAVWCPPYSLEVTKSLKSGENKIRIEVANTALNYMAGHSLPDYRLLNLRYGERFQAQDMDKIRPLPSGMLGPIKLISIR
ncbi:MAG TPA: glycosyl hydrolase [Pyrinomonadaceae bacterium]|nr:glycosyl hydrolase [Pyrinomonadaceae bacterium]